MHIVSAVVWLGAMLFLVMVMLPTARQAMRPKGLGEGLDILWTAAGKFLPVIWTAMFLLGLSSGYLALEHWGIRPEVFLSEGGRS